MTLERKAILICTLCLLRCLWAVDCLAQRDSTILTLWTKGAPGFESRRDEPEKGGKYPYNIHNPSITVYLPPKDKATGAAVLVIPGGGHHMLVINSEGREPARFLNSIGIAAIVLKYRLARDTNSPYKVEVHAPQDAWRAMRLIRSNAAKWGIDPNRIGCMGFSAGGEVTDMVTFAQEPSTDKKSDAIDQLSSKPNFIVLVYPGPLGVPEVVPKDAPPAFLVAANEDECCSLPIMQLLQRYRDAHVPVEAHIYSHGAHAFNMGTRVPYKSLKAWPQTLANWFEDNNYFRTVTNK